MDRMDRIGRTAAPLRDRAASRPGRRRVGLALLAALCAGLAAPPAEAGGEAPVGGPGAPRSASPLFGYGGPSGSARVFRRDRPSAGRTAPAGTAGTLTREALRQRLDAPSRFEADPGPFERRSPPPRGSSRPGGGVPEVGLGLDALDEPFSGGGSRGGPSGEVDSDADRAARDLLEATGRE